jgi:hypothetical protein
MVEIGPGAQQEWEREWAGSSPAGDQVKRCENCKCKTDFKDNDPENYEDRLKGPDGLVQGHFRH